MERYSRKNLDKIQNIVQEKTGVDFSAYEKKSVYKTRQFALLTCCLICVVTLSAFAYVKFSDLNGDTAGFAAVYQGDGKFEIVVENYSDVELKLQNNVKVMQWSTGQEVPGDNKKVKMFGLNIAPHSQGVVSIDISEGYDISAMQEKLPDDDWYYFVLTNNNFVFGQDWQCSFDFVVEDTAEVANRLALVREQNNQEQYKPEPQDNKNSLIYGDWDWPTVSQTVSGLYGKRQNGSFSDHINIAGASGDDVYAVADGVITKTGFENSGGNYILLELENGVAVKYGHLAEINVAVGDDVKQGQSVATLGQTGMATGPNLLFAVTVNGENVNPLLEDDISLDKQISQIFADCADKHIQQRIETAEGISLVIDSPVTVDGINKVSQYEYILTDINEDIRFQLFKAVFGEIANKAEYDELNDVWTLTINSGIIPDFLYHISYSNGGSTIPGEQIIILDNRYYDLYPFEDNRLPSVFDSKLDFTLDEAENLCRQAVSAIDDNSDYTLSYIHAYGNNGRRPYLKLVFKQMLDGMPVTAYNNLSFLVDNDGIERVSGSLFSVKEVGLPQTILSVDEALAKLQADFVPENSMTVTDITLEYLTLISEEGRILITPVWRFWLGANEDERNFMCQKILAINAVTGQLIYEERGNTM